MSKRKTHRDELAEYRLADARNFSQALPDGAEINLTITSPPYWNLKDYKSKKQIGFYQTYDDYLNDIERVFSEVHKRTASTGTLWMISDTLKLDGDVQLLPFDIAARMKKIGWRLQDIIIWQKDRTLPWSHQGKLRNIFEYITFFSKSSDFQFHVDRVRDISDVKDYWVRYPERYSPAGKAPSRSWNFAIPRQGSWGTASNYVRHACPLPIGLVQRIVELASEPRDLVVDPFAGSGTVLGVASAMGRQYFGTDVNETYQRQFHKKVLASIGKTLGKPESSSVSPDRETFKNLVQDLRYLKYPKELLRLYARTHKNVKCGAILVLPDRKKPVPSLMIVMVGLGGRGLDASKKLTRLCERPPLSKYGFTPKVVVLKRLGAPAKKLLAKSPRDWHLYGDGRFYKYSERVQKNDIREAIEKYRELGHKHPPILSPIGIDIDIADPQKSIVR